MGSWRWCARRSGEDPFSGTIFVFRSKRADRLKIVARDGSGLMLFWKRLEQGAFRWPPISDGVMRLTAAQLADRRAHAMGLGGRSLREPPSAAFVIVGES
jgi:transposase